MDVKTVINIDAFSKGLSMVSKSYGGIIPIAVVNIIQTKVSPMVPNSYGSQLVDAGFFMWKTYIAAGSGLN